jgi:hypothetical protein
MSWEIGLACIKLASLAGAHDLVGISDRGGQIEALAERVAHEDNTPPTKAAPPSPSVGASTRTHTPCLHFRPRFM